MSSSLCPCIHVSVHSCEQAPYGFLDLSLSGYPPSLTVGCMPGRLSVSPCACFLLTPQVTQRIATCQPLSGALDNSRVILCDMMADPWVSAFSSSGLMDVETPKTA